MTLYSPLLGPKPIRLLRLHPRNDGEQISCSLLCTNISNSERQYDAVSYTWGADFATQDIVLEGTVLGVRPSVYEILDRFRDDERPRMLWIDSLCINQDDLEERAQQVTFMKDIYKLARSVLIWLGTKTPGTTQAMEYCSNIEPAKILEEIKFGRTVHLTNPDDWLGKSTIFDNLTETTPENRKLLEALVELVGRPWFSRIWIQQEAAFHRETVVFCGQQSITWDQLSVLCWLLRPGKSSTWPDWVIDLYPDIQTPLLAMYTVQLTRWTAFDAIDVLDGSYLALGFASLLEATWVCAATDPRDKIFALRSMTNLQIFDWVPKPNYLVAWEDLYTDVAIGILKHEKNVASPLDLLRCAGRTNQDSDSCLPSWVPDWRVWPGNEWAPPNAWKAGSRRSTVKRFGLLSKQELNTLRPSKKIGKSSPKQKLAARSTLTTTCIMQDSIQFLSGVADKWMEFNGVIRRENESNYSQAMLELDSICRVQLQNQLPQTYVTGESTTDAYRATLISNRTHEIQIASPPFYQKHEEWIFTLNEDTKGAHKSDFEAAIQESNVFHKQQICTTSHGYLCLVPARTTKDDFVAILAGLDMPIILRPIGKYYELLGSCYVHGLMEGQAYFLIDEHNLKSRGDEDSDADAKKENRRLSVIQIEGTENKDEDYSSVAVTLGVRSIVLI